MSVLEWVRGNTPKDEGWYRVLHPGDSESIDGHTIYEYGDYPGWAYWNPDQEREEIWVDQLGRGVLKAVKEECEAHWTCEHDEDGNLIIAFCGPYFILELLPELKS